MLEKADRKIRLNRVKNDLNKCGLDIGLAKDRERWKAQVMRKTSDLCEHRQGM